MNKAIKFFILIFFLVQIGSGFAQQTLLNYRPDARSISLGGSLLAATNDASAIFWNPAALPMISEIKATVSSFHPYQLDYGGAIFFLPPRTSIGLSFAQTAPGSEGYQIVSGAWGLRPSRSLSFGTNINILTHAEESWPTAGVSFIFTPLSSPSVDNEKKDWLTKIFQSDVIADRTTFALSVHNLPLVLGDIDHEIRVGMSYRFDNNLPVLHLGSHFHRGDESVHFGLEWHVFNGFSLGVGLQNFDVKKAGAGIGVHWKNLNFTAAYSEVYDHALLTLSVNLGEDAGTRAENYYQQGLQSVKQGKNRDALRDFESAQAFGKSGEQLHSMIAKLALNVEREDAKIDSLIHVAKQFQDKGWYISATLNYLEVLKMHPQNKEAMRNIRLIKPKVNIYTEQLYQGAVEHFRKNNFQKAKEIFYTILLVQENHEGARIYLDKTVKVLQEHARAHYLKGHRFYGNGQLSEAKAEFEEALALYPNYENAQHFLREVRNEISELNSQINQILADAMRAERENKVVHANQKYKQVLALDPNHKTAQLGNQRIEPLIESSIRTKMSQGIRAFNNGNYTQAQQLFAQVLTISSEHQEAKNYLRRITRAVSRDVESYYQSALANFNAQDYSIALNDINKALALQSNHSTSLRLQAQIISMLDTQKLFSEGQRAYNNQQYQQALQFFSQALQANPDNSEARQMLERCQIKLRDLAEEYFNRGMAHYSNQEYSSAIELWERVLDINPSHAGALEYIRKAQEQVRALEVLTETP